MKLFFLLIAICSAGFLFAGDRKSILRQNYLVVSDEYNSEVPSGKCLIKGMVMGPNYTADGKQIPLNGATISTLDRKKSCVADNQGNYKLLLDVADTTVYMFMAGYEEIVIWNYNFQSKHVVTINFYPYFDQIYEVDKPVIYLYSEEEVNAEVKFSCKGDLTFTYPVYDEVWKVQVNSSGLKDAETGKQYPYLFWEAETNDLDFKFETTGITAAVINTDSVVNYLEKTLTIIGLNQSEQTDFITFWAPQMIEYEFVLVQFLMGDLYAEKISTLQIAPEPESLLRVFMLWQPMASNKVPYELLPQKFEKFERKGFTAVEWGGAKLPFIELIP
jgi:hypothetical protein